MCLVISSFFRLLLYIHQMRKLSQGVKGDLLRWNWSWAWDLGLIILNPWLQPWLLFIQGHVVLRSKFPVLSLDRRACTEPHLNNECSLSYKDTFPLKWEPAGEDVSLITWGSMPTYYQKFGGSLVSYFESFLKFIENTSPSCPQTTVPL